jgi:hypothetical protein
MVIPVLILMAGAGAPPSHGSKGGPATIIVIVVFAVTAVALAVWRMARR